MSKTKNYLSLTNQTFYDSYKARMTHGKNGDLVFPESSLSVFYVGSLLEFGETKNSILNDYPYLTVDDLKFAKFHHRIESNKDVDETPDALTILRLIEKTGTLK